MQQKQGQQLSLRHKVVRMPLVIVEDWHAQAYPRF